MSIVMDEFIAAKHPVPDPHTVTERWSTYLRALKLVPTNRGTQGHAITQIL